MTFTPQKIAQKLIKWYKQNSRDLPWRHTTDPYQIWLSEIILQQTTVAQGINYYYKILELYPTVFDLAHAPLDDLLKAWQGLGYYSRARNLHSTAQYIVQENNGIFPKTYVDLLKLKGVGEYTAAAIASFCYNQNKVVVDGNVIRVVSRLYGIKDPVDDRQTLKKIKNIAQDLCDTQKPQIFNQAIMEFGAIQCKAKKPSCQTCPLNKSCIAFQNEDVNFIPFKAKRIKKKKRFFKYFFFVIDQEKTLIKKRSHKDIWQGLYEFPSIELESFDNNKVINFGIKTQDILLSKPFKQQLTHQTINALFYKVYLDNKNYKLLLRNKEFKECEEISVENLNNYAWPRIIDLYLNDLSITLF